MLTQANVSRLAKPQMSAHSHLTLSTRSIISKKHNAEGFSFIENVRFGVYLAVTT